MRLRDFSFALLLTACATQTTPVGGPKDVTPPRLLESESTPTPNQVNFRGKQLELVFNEDVILKNAKDELIITPSPGREISIKSKKNVVTIEPKDGWQDSTTYSIAFRDGIVDITEGNPVKDLTLAFSTGTYLDSLTISGRVRLSLEDKEPPISIVALYASDTFNILKHKPTYFAKSDKTGQYKLKNLKPGTYYIYAFADKNKNLTLETQNEYFGFLSTPTHLTKDTTVKEIELIRLDTRRVKLNSARSIGDMSTLRFNKPIVNYAIECTDRIPNAFGTTQAEVELLLTNLTNDSTKIHLTATDSLHQKIDTTLYIKKTSAKRNPSKFDVTITDISLQKETGNLKATINTSKPIHHFNLDSFRIAIDSTTIIPTARQHFSVDTLSKKAYFLTTLSTISSSKTVATPKFLLGKNFVTSFEHDSVRRQEIPISITTLEETATLILDIKTTVTAYIVDIVTNNNKLVSRSINPKKLTIKYLTPDTYKIRITIDSNRNGQWDPGNPLTKEEPEHTFFYHNSENKTEIPVRANWEVGPYVINF